MLRIEVVTSEAGFDSLREDWDNLLRKGGQCSPFLSHGWFRCCLTTLSRPLNLSILIVREEARVVGIAPFRLYDGTVREISARMIGFLTCLDTPFVDFIVEEERREEVLATILHYLYSEYRDVWDVLVCNQWAIDSANKKTCEGLLEKNKRNYLSERSSLIPYITIGESWEDFLLTRSVRFRKTYRNIINKVNKFPNVEIQCFTRNDTETALEEAIGVSKGSWKQGDGIAISSSEKTKEFFSHLTRLATQKGWLLLWLMKIGGVPVAMEYDLLDAGKVYALRADFAEAYRMYSPGAYLEYHIIKRLFEEGYKEYNTGPGASAYKLKWTEDVRENVTVRVCNDNLKGHMIWGVEGKFIPFLKRIRDIKDQIGFER